MRLGTVLLIFSAFTFGFMALLRHLAADVSVPMLLCLRFGIGAGVMFIIALARGERLPRGRLLLMLLSMGAIGYFGESFLYFEALSYAPSGIVALMLYTYPAVVTVLAVVFLKERLKPAKVLAVGLAIGGCALTALPGLRDPEHPVHPLGVALGLCCSVLYSIYVIVGARLPKTPALPASAVVAAGASAMFAAVLCAQAVHTGGFEALPHGTRAWMGILGLAVICTVIGITLFLAGLARVGPVQASTLSTIEPIATAVVGAVALGERMGWVQWLGGGLIILAAVIMARAGAAASTS